MTTDDTFSTTHTIPFRAVNISDGSWIKERITQSDFNGCEYSFANIFIWASVYQFQVADSKGFLIIRTVVDGKVMHYFPAGLGDTAQVIRNLAKDARQIGHPLVFGNATAEHISMLEEMFPGAFTCAQIPEASDYIYSREKLVTLAGKKLHGKRNHINRFKDNPNWSFEMMTDENLQECFEMSLAWNARYFGDKILPPSDPAAGDLCAIGKSFKYFHELGLEGGLLRQDGRIVALTIGEPLNSNTYVVHIEKAFHDVQGAYPMINQQFAAQLPEKFTYINREEDLGEEGLRRSKMSYYPEILLAKSIATLTGNIL